MPQFTSPRRLAAALFTFVCAITTSNAQSYAVTGAGGRDNVQPRLEIGQLKQDKDAWNLFLLTMSYWQGKGQDDIDSYYKVSAIHGVPFESWDGVEGLAGAQTGYCTHSSPLFPAWHRAYMALYEQAFLKQVKEITGAYPAGEKRDRYQRAAQNLRVPYWDWATGQGLPSAITDETVNLDTPEGPMEILNPLMQYEFDPLDRKGFRQGPWDGWNYTRRYPDSEASTARSQQDGATQSVAGAGQDLKNKVSNILTFCKTYSGFANADKSGTTPDCPNAMETIHNDIHLDMGGPSGTMTVLWYSSYDPVFWLHHANVDRIFALWQALNPKSYSFDTKLAQGTYTTAEGTQVDVNSPLQPFHKDTAGKFWTSNDVRDTKIFGYTYPELNDGKTTVGDIRGKVQKLYGASGEEPKKTSRKRSMISYTAPDFSNKGYKSGSSQATEEKPDQEKAKDVPSKDSEKSPSSDESPAKSGGYHAYQPGKKQQQQQPQEDEKETPKKPSKENPKKTSKETPKDSSDSKSSPSDSKPAQSKPYTPKVPDTKSPKKPYKTTPLQNSPGYTKPKTPTMNTSMNKHYTSNGTTIIEYSTTIACEAYALNGSYAVHVFLGAPESEKPSTWSTDKNRCGVHSSFSSPGMNSKTVNTGSVSLSAALDARVANGIIPDSSPSSVLPYLKDQLTWRAALQDGTSISPDKVPGLAIGVASQKIKPAKTSRDFPEQQGGYTIHKDVTHGKPAGIKTTQQLRTNFPLPCDACNPASVAGSNRNEYTAPFNPPATVPADYSADEGRDIPASSDTTEKPTPTEPESQSPPKAEYPQRGSNTPRPPPLKDAPANADAAPVYPQGNDTAPPQPTAPTGSLVPTPEPTPAAVSPPYFTDAAVRLQGGIGWGGMVGVVFLGIWGL